MTHTECMELQRQARRSGRLTGNALMLLAEICDAHTLEKGCIVENETFADRLNCTKRTVRNWLSDLKSEGVLSVAQEGGNRVLIPRFPSWMGRKNASGEESSFQESGDSSGKDAPERKEFSEASGKDFPPQRDNNHESASSRAREDRWAFLPDYRMRHLPEIKSEAGDAGHSPDVLAIARRYLDRSEGDLASTVDHHLEQRPEDEVIAAYVIAGREADSPLDYADKIIREGWKQGRVGGDGMPVGESLTERFGDQDVIHFGQQ